MSRPCSRSGCERSQLVVARLDDPDVGFGHGVPGPFEVAERLRDHDARLVRQACELRALRVKCPQRVHSRPKVERARLALAGVPEAVPAPPAGGRDRHLDRVVDSVSAPGVLDEGDHTLDRGNGIVLEPEGQGEVEHRLGVGRAFDRVEERVVDRQHELTPKARELANQPVVHPQPPPMTERVRVGLLDRRARRRADVREEEVRGDPGGELAQVAVVPGRVGAAVDPRRLAVLVPADAEAVAVRRRRALTRVQALVDQRTVALDEQLLEPDRRPRIREPTAHRYSFLSSSPIGLVGMAWARNSASNASTARIPRAERRPASRASAFAASAASAAAEVAPASSSAASRSASETNTTPPASSTCACSFASAGMAGLCSMLVRNADVNEAIISEPASAVPSDAPRFVMVFWTPPTTGLSSSGTAETVTAPSCEASAPMPRPTSSIGTNTTSGPASASSAPRRTMVPASSDSSPTRTTSRGERCGRKRGIPIAAASSVTESGRSRMPVSIADKPSATERKSGTTKKKPACTRYWKKNMVKPPVSCRLRSIAVRTSGSSPRDPRRACQRKNSQITNRPPSTSQNVGEMPAHEGPSALGSIQPHSPERSTPKTSRARPSADSTAPTTSSCGRSSTGASAIRRAKTRITSTSRTSPAKTQRHEK